MAELELKGSDHPEEEKKVSPTLEKPPLGKEMDLVDQVWERLVKTTHQALSWNEGFKEENAGLGLRIQDLYCAILLLYNDINKTLRPGPHRDPPTKKEIQKCIKAYGGEVNEDAVLDLVDFKLFFEIFTKNAIRRDELQAFFKIGTNPQFARLGSYTGQDSDCSSRQEAGPSRHVKTEDSEDPLYMKKLKESKNAAADAEDSKAPNGGWNVLRHGRTDSAVNLNSFSGGSHFQIFNFANADMDSLATFVKQIRK